MSNGIYCGTSNLSFRRPHGLMQMRDCRAEFPSFDLAADPVYSASNLAGELERACQTKQNFAEHSGVSIKLFIEPSATGYFYVEHASVVEIFENLLSNAIARNAKGIVSVKMRALFLERSPGVFIVEIDVHDADVITPPMDDPAQPETSDTDFENFHQTARLIAQWMGGDMLVLPQANRGKLVRLALPLKRYFKPAQTESEAMP